MTFLRVDAGFIGEAFLGHKGFGLPEQPRLLPELVILPFKTDGILFVGAKVPQLIRGKAARSLVQSLLKHLDGTRTLAELSALLPEVPVRHLHDSVALLHSRGLLEDGRPSAQAPAALVDVEAFLGRYIDVTRVNGNRGQALGRVRAARVLVGGSEESAVDEFVTLLRACGMDSARRGLDADITFGGFDLVIGIATGDEDTANSLVDAACRQGIHGVHIRIAGDGAQIGPLLLPPRSVCRSCYSKRCAPLRGDPTADDVSYWLGMAAQQILNHVAKIVASLNYHDSLVCKRDVVTGEISSEIDIIVRRPGCDACGMSGSHLDPESPAHTAWVVYTNIEMPCRDLLAPKDFQGHFEASNVALERTAFDAIDGAAVIPLQAALPLTEGRAAIQDAASGVDLTRLTSLIQRAFGYSTHDGELRKIAPSGGNLGSPDLFVAAFDVEGLPPALYHYDGPRHRLEKVGGIVEESVLAGIGATVLPKCLLIAAGRLGRLYSKYRDRGYAFAYLDSGVALMYVHEIAATLGLAVHEFPDIDDDRLAQLLGLPTEYEEYVLTFALALGGTRGNMREAPCPILENKSPVPRPTKPGRTLFSLLEAAKRPSAGKASHQPVRPATSRRPVVEPAASLDRAMLSRHAVRNYAEMPIPAAELRRFVMLAAGVNDHRLDAGAAPPVIRLWLAVRLGDSELPAGLFEGSLERPGELTRRASLSLEDMHACTSQASLAAAPATFFLVGNLGQHLVDRGARGYRELLQQAGAVAARVWLAAEAIGIGACAGGGLMPIGIRELAGLDGFMDCPLFSIHLGYPKVGVASGK